MTMKFNPRKLSIQVTEFVNSMNEREYEEKKGGLKFLGIKSKTPELEFVGEGRSDLGIRSGSEGNLGNFYWGKDVLHSRSI